MRIFTSLVAGAVIFASSNLMAETLKDKKIKNIIGEMGDKEISFEEYYQETVTKNDDSMDVNKDGYITPGEVSLEIREDLVETVEQMRKHGVSDKNAAATIMKELNSLEKDSRAIVKKMDKDGDMLVEPEELKVYKQAQFDSLDKNKDGVLSHDDIIKKSPDNKKYQGFPIIIRDQY